MSAETTTAGTTGRGGPLAGRLVVDLSRALAGPHAGMMLGDLGARVIKVETPGTGDDTRGWGPPFVGPEEDRQATYFLSCNRNKESIALDLKSDDGRGVLTELLRRADVVVENFRPGVLDRLGFSTDAMLELNPGLVILSITGFGHDGPEAKRSGYDQIVQGEAGLMSLTGPDPDNPQRVGVPIADLLSGMYGAYGAVAALLERERTGRGQVVRTSLLAAIIGVHAFQGTRTTVAGEVPQAQGNHHPSIAPYGLFNCRGGKVQISVGSEKLWATFTTAFGLDGGRPEFATNADRVRNRDLLIGVVEDAFSAYEAEPLLARLNEAGIPAGKVRTLDEVYAWDQVHSQGLLLTVQHALLGEIALPGPPLRFFDGPTETTPAGHTAPPLLDGDGDAIRAWLAAPGGSGA
ncbi:CaiB/BaiF CoA transferase family protein [Arthrobacter agilis]|jgi:crotonobetainyl-CoA:carnitine CoA-transferase CaiB-like acyl-CoA transferase|uniref:CaiB/BaiF CoA transferase family protein n=1 Tax=Arthrobacter agilis TaxID=37921 RepID=UPI00277E39B5|nr:CoA transferase [Arthrobacter agilis]MDQ0736712.1 crotonobetainyl-CoA:carnitine CoA-transferase CaiB-like acyl-CoA transferase [Arthrobacter agilis]